MENFYKSANRLSFVLLYLYTLTNYAPFAKVAKNFHLRKCSYIQWELKYWVMGEIPQLIHYKPYCTISITSHNYGEVVLKSVTEISVDIQSLSN